MKNKKFLIFGGIALVVILVGALLLTHFLKPKSGDVVYVTKISELTNSVSGVNRFTGLVVTQDTVDIKKDSSKKVEAIYVTVGQQVVADTALFKYSISELENRLASASIEIESIDSEISNVQKELEEIRGQLNSGNGDAETLAFEIRLREKQIREFQYQRQLKQVDIGHIQKEIENSTVYAGSSGIIKAINNSDENPFDNTPKPFIQIAQSTDFRIKAKVDEKNISMLTADMPVIVRSRNDESKIWPGKVTRIVTTPEGDNSNDHGPSVGGFEPTGEKMSMYPFYVSLNSSEGLLLGQHVFVEPDMGQGQVKEGLWLDASYFILNDEEKTGIAWTANSQNKLQQVMVEFGEFDAELNQYQILNGLTTDDRIAWPMEHYKEGLPVVDIGSSVEGE